MQTEFACLHKECLKTRSAERRHWTPVVHFLQTHRWHCAPLSLLVVDAAGLSLLSCWLLSWTSIFLGDLALCTLHLKKQCPCMELASVFGAGERQCSGPGARRGSAVLGQVGEMPRWKIRGPPGPSRGRCAVRSIKLYQRRPQRLCAMYTARCVCRAFDGRGCGCGWSWRPGSDVGALVKPIDFWLGRPPKWCINSRV